MIKGKGIVKRSIAVGLMVIVSLGLTYEDTVVDSRTLVHESNLVEGELPAYVPSEEEVLYSYAYDFPFLGKSFNGFKEALAFKESGGNYFSVNTYGYLGKYQFGKSTLRLIGVYAPNRFLNNPALQEKAFVAYTSRNKWVLRRDIDRFVGRKFQGISITESGILAAAHLAGPGHVKRYLRSYGKIGFKDGYGTSINSYMKKFSGYATSIIEPNQEGGWS